jgi:hypothetical protein
MTNPLSAKELKYLRRRAAELQTDGDVDEFAEYAYWTNGPVMRLLATIDTLQAEAEADKRTIEDEYNRAESPR